MSIHGNGQPTATVRQALLALLDIDPQDIGCGQTWELIHRYCDLALAGQDPEQHLPGVTAHLRQCDECAHDYQSLIDLAVGPADEAPASAPVRLSGTADDGPSSEPWRQRPGSAPPSAETPHQPMS